MSSKICPDCGRRVTVGGMAPRFCAWGCGSLENEPIAPDIETAEALEKEFERIRNHIPRKIIPQIQEPEQPKTDLKGNLLLFGTKFIRTD